MKKKQISRTKRQLKLMARYGPRAIVTGASEGIGEAFAMQLGKAGFDLVLVARRLNRLEELANRISDQNAVKVQVIDADLSSDKGVSRVLQSTRPLDIGLLVACAGFGTSGEFIHSSLHQELEMLDVNCRAVLMLAHEFARRFNERGKGGIVLMSSIVAFQGVPRAAHYASTKAYVQTLAEGLHKELSPRGIDTVSCAPGPVQSGFARRANMEMGLALRPDIIATSTLSALGRKVTVRPGWLSKLLESLLKLPRWARTRIMAEVMKGMTKHQFNQAALKR